MTRLHWSPNEPSKMVPRDVQKNLPFRMSVREQAWKNRSLQNQLMNACRNDILFWLNVFGMVYEPRKGEPIPFVTWTFQNPLLKELVRALPSTGWKGEDVGIEKSRDMGLTWVCCAVLAWRFLFYPWESYLVVSRKEDLVDKKGDPDTLFWKIKFLVDQCPKWMRPRMDKRKMHMENLDTNTVIDGESTTGDVGRGGRRTAIFFDEFAAVPADQSYACLKATQSNSNCRFFPSTPKGSGGAFYDLMHKDGLAIKRLNCHWSEHPEYRKGLYEVKSGKVRVHDARYWSEYAKGKGYSVPVEMVNKKFSWFITEFGLDDKEPRSPRFKFRSPWYNLQCRRTPIEVLIGQELDIDYGGSQAQFFDPNQVGEIKRKLAREPVMTGELSYRDDEFEPITFVRDKRDGPI